MTNTCRPFLMPLHPDYPNTIKFSSGEAFDETFDAAYSLIRSESEGFGIYIYTEQNEAYFFKRNKVFSVPILKCEYLSGGCLEWLKAHQDKMLIVSVGEEDHCHAELAFEVVKTNRNVYFYPKLEPQKEG